MLSHECLFLNNNFSLSKTLLNCLALLFLKQSISLTFICFSVEQYFNDGKELISPKQKFLNAVLKVSILQTYLVWLNHGCNVYNHIKSIYYFIIVVFNSLLYFTKHFTKCKIKRFYSHFTFNRFYTHVSKPAKKMLNINTPCFAKCYFSIQQ